MPEFDENEEAIRNVEKITDSEPAKGEDLLKSEELKRRFIEEKKQGESEASDY